MNDSILSLFRTAITGGIGSGKSHVCRLLEAHGIKVYDCDAAAKHLMHTDPALQQALRLLVGEEAYNNKVLQKQVLATFLLAGEANKQALNDIVHPAVAQDFERSGYEWLESAILFDSGFNRRLHFDRVVRVTAPLEVRVQRIMLRDHISREKALAWIDSQLPQEEVARRSDYVIVNDGHADLEAQIANLLSLPTTPLPIKKTNPIQ